MKLGVYGGSFDPVHYGHLLLAETCREACGLDEVWLVPNANPPHKRGATLTPVRQRLEMLELALGDAPGLRVSAIEAERDGLSYTVETLEQLHRERPERELYFLMGADSLQDLPTWREPERICQLATLLIVGRPGMSIPDLSVLEQYLAPDRIDAVRRHYVEMPLIALSSTDLRQRIRSGKSIRFRTPRAVEEYIRYHHLYGDTT